jgi:hypothetical protein
MTRLYCFVFRLYLNTRYSLAAFLYTDFINKIKTFLAIIILTADFDKNSQRLTFERGLRVRRFRVFELTSDFSDRLRKLYTMNLYQILHTKSIVIFEQVCKI